ncbi:tyrosine-type recombinase/integrase [Desulfofundulus thermobenzoicus]|uniref:Tyrosine-type recombinase/integrase n=1 Tax=Desulfofundulus thermobenzoicus TaxID=29376 RepID=A0A6N7IVA4_9FIRM|nr:tyrosine-type recombinase/integrase [Desulfofundulus thermobenzoicus]MQL54012.1 tyrosine-type recombinase/integrase [Desulfofundulus thermobenzoicus]
MAKGKVLKLRKDVPATWEEALQQFIWWKQGEQKSKRTIEDYRYHVTRFFTNHPDAYNPRNLKKCVLEYMAMECKPATFNLRLTYLKTFFKWAVREGIFPENPLEGFQKKKDEGRVTEVDTETLEQLLSLPDRTTFAGLRDHALFLLTLDTGIRPSEAFSLLIDDFNLKNLEVTIRRENAKTRETRTLPILPVTANAVRELIAARHPAWKKTVPVFCTQDGTPLNRHTWNDRLEMYSRKLGVKIWPYALRHAFALTYIRNGGYELGLQRTLGHHSLTMTRRYVNLTQADLRAMNTAASPLNSLLPQRHRVRKRR